MKAELVKRVDRYDLYGADGSKIASSSPNPFGKLSVENCDEIFEEDEVVNVELERSFRDSDGCLILKRI